MSDQSNGGNEKKIIIDEDWKSKVDAEREEQQKQPAEPETPPQAEPPLPPATLDFLISSLAMQAMVALGVMVNPITEKAEAHLDQAKHFIDTVDMLREKTEGNRTPEETAMIDNLLHELRMTFLAIQQGGGQ